MKPLIVKSPARIREIINSTNNWVRRGAMAKKATIVPRASLLADYNNGEHGGYIQVYPGRVVFIPAHKSGVFYEASKGE